MANGRRDSRTGSIYKDGDGYRAVLMVGYDAKTGKPRYRKVRTTTHDQAVDALDKLQGNKRAGKLGQAQGATVESYLRHWLENKIKPMRAPNTYRQYKWVVDQHIVPNLGRKRLDSVTRPEVQALIAAKAKQEKQPRIGDKAKAKLAREEAQKAAEDPNYKKPEPPAPVLLSRGTLRIIRAILHSAYEDAIRDSLASRNPASYIELPPERKRRPEFLDPTQATALLNAARESELSELLWFMLTTGTRIGEATGVRWQDFDMKARHVRICGQLQRDGSKLVRREVTKTNQDRTLPIGSELVAALQALKSRQMVDGMEDPEGIVFLNAYGRKLDPKYVAGRLKALCRTAKIPEVSPHKLRHSAATLALAETGDLHAVQKLLGHQQVSLTADLYAHATAETLRPVADAIERAFRPKPSNRRPIEY